MFSYRRLSTSKCTVMMAEGEGFEPTNEETPLPVFKTGAFSRSATPPQLATLDYASTNYPTTTLTAMV